MTRLYRDRQGHVFSQKVRWSGIERQLHLDRAPLRIHGRGNRHHLGRQALAGKRIRRNHSRLAFAQLV